MNWSFDLDKIETETDFIKEIVTEKGSIRVTRREHPGYREYTQASAEGKWPTSMPSLFGKWQYWYRNEKGDLIDAVLLPNYFRDGQDFWAIYSSGTLFEDIERYRTLEEAEKRIEELLLK